MASGRKSREELNDYSERKCYHQRKGSEVVFKTRTQRDEKARASEGLGAS